MENMKKDLMKLYRIISIETIFPTWLDLPGGNLSNLESMRFVIIG